MELTTTVIDGVEYVLVPKTLVDEPKEEVRKEAPTIGLAGFLPEDVVGEPPTEEKREEVWIVEPAAVSGVKQAKGKSYAYREKYLQHALLPHDVMTFPTVGQSIKNFTESKEIRSADFGNRIPPGKWGFYGPGIEADVIY